MKSDKSVVLVTQKNSEVDDPNIKDLFSYGCLSKVLQLLKLPDGTVKVLVEGQKRVKIIKCDEDKNRFLSSEVEVVEDKNNNFKETSLFAQSLIKKFEKLTLISKKEMNESLSVLKNNEDSSLISNTIAGSLNI